VFDVVQEADGGYCAECLTENIFTEGDTWDDLRRNVIEATNAFFFDQPRPEQVRLHLGSGRNPVCGMRVPRDVSGAHRADTLCRRWQYTVVHQVGSHVILETSEPFHQRISIPDHDPLRLGTFISILRSPATKASHATQSSPPCSVRTPCLHWRSLWDAPGTSIGIRDWD